MIALRLIPSAAADMNRNLTKPSTCHPPINATPGINGRIQLAAQCLLTGALVAGLCPSAKAQIPIPVLDARASVNVDVDATAGLDQPTRDLIASLPSNVREQVIRLLKEALPLIDASFDSYVKRVNDIIESTLNDVVCKLSATSGGMAESIKSAVGIKSYPTTDLQKRFDDREAVFDASSIPVLARQYEDFLRQAAVNSCGQPDVQARAGIDGLRKEARPRWRMWLYAEQDKCATPAACAATQRGRLEELISKGDQRDLEATNARALLSAIAPTHPPRARLFGGPKIGPWLLYENEMLQLAIVETAVDQARDIRTSRARAFLSKATVLIRRAEADAATALSKATLQAGDRQANLDAVQLCEDALTNVAVINFQVSEAVKGDATLAHEAQLANLKLASAELIARRTATSAQAQAESLQKQADQAAADARERQRERRRKRPFG